MCRGLVDGNSSARVGQKGEMMEGTPLSATEIHQLLLSTFQLGEEWESKIEHEAYLLINPPFAIRYGQYRMGSLATFFFTGIRCGEMEELLTPLHEKHGFPQLYTSFDFHDKRCSPAPTLTDASQIKTIADDLWPKIKARLSSLGPFKDYQKIEAAVDEGVVTFKFRRVPLLRRLILKRLAGAEDYREYLDQIRNKTIEEGWQEKYAIDFQYVEEVSDLLDSRFA